MSFSPERIPYRHTGSFSKIVLDYLDDATGLRKFYRYRPDIDGIKKAVEERSKFRVNRHLLVSILQKQYAGLDISPKLEANISALLNEDAFTICTAHQPNIFTGHLYFIYKILHAVKLADELNEKIPGKKFVPVYYMGSEDADLDELGEVNIHGKQYRWETKQTGAVGRMKIDKAFTKLIDAIEGQLSVEQYGAQVITALKRSYKEGSSIEEATFHFVHSLFNDLGLVILLPDNRELKNKFSAVIKKELEEHFSRKAVDAVMAEFPAEYKVQAAGRDINLFYLEDNSRERIEKTDDGFELADSHRKFSAEELNRELKKSPEKFSPNVILRPVFQEMILPDVVFIGGGGELAYWLELKNVFEKVNAFFPVLMLRNSFTLVNKKTADLLHKLQLKTEDIFHSERTLLKKIVEKNSAATLNLDAEKQQLKQLYEKAKINAVGVDPTLGAHTEALYTHAFRRMEALEKKMLRAEKKKFEAEQRQIIKMKATLYPGGVLQERVGNILEYLVAHNNDFLYMLYDHSQAFSQSFTVITEL